MPRLPHLKIDVFHQSLNYTYPRQGIGADFDLRQRDRAIHGNRLLVQMENIRQQLELSREHPLPPDIVREDVIYVEFYSDWNFSLKFDSLNENALDPSYQLLNIREESRFEGDEHQKRYKVAVMMKQGGVSKFIRKIEDYLTRNTKQGGVETDRPKNQALINNIESIQVATLQSFWTDAPEHPFPNEEDLVWWEVWFRKTQDDTTRIANVLQNLHSVGAQIGQASLNFPEHHVRLIRGTVRQLASSLLLLDNLAEMRKPQEINDFIASDSIDFEGKQEWLQDLRARTDINLDDTSVLICLLDSGVNNRHPLLNAILPDTRMYSYKATWGTGDTWSEGGHGTPMAGLSIYGDLTDAMASQNRISIYFGLESYKIIHPNDPNDPAFYGVITELACSTPITTTPDNLRVFCMSITDGTVTFRGRPSSWSASVDKITFGSVLEPLAPQLFILSSGNVNYLNGSIPDEYPSKNETESIHDPSQAFNALAIGSYTRMDRIDQNIWPGVTCLAPNGKMAPSNSTSLMWPMQWPIKPDLVMEGGNLGVDGRDIKDHVYTIKPLSLDKDIRNYIFYPFGDTSGAAALAARMAADLRHNYPEYWPETIRGLMVHSAEWTDGMLEGFNLSNASAHEKRTLLRSYGYGVPNIEKAMESAGNRLTLVAESYLQPFIQNGSEVGTNEYHLYEIPWPVAVLRDELTDADVKLKVTLSYYIEPNPGNKQYASNFQYFSHSLDFKVIRPTEDIDAFRRRVSSENEQAEYDGTQEPWVLKEIVRNRGSIKKDFIIASGADLSTRNIIAIYPKNGWYRTRKKLGRANSEVRYSLIISLETQQLDVDLYTPVHNAILTAIPV